MKHSNIETTRILLLTDYRSQFYFSTKYRGASVNISRLEKIFKESNFSLTVRKFSEINFREENYEGNFILYNSSEDPLLRYKGYIEDIILGLHYQGAVLIPSFYYFRAHQNKVFMEIIRDLLLKNNAGNILSKVYGTYEDYLTDLNNEKLEQRFVIKPNFGTRSKGIKLLTSPKDKKNYPFKLSRTFTLHNIKWAISRFFTDKPYTRQSNNRKSFIVQNFIDNIEGDFRIIVYHQKYYVLYRKNRKDDFRASGSGNFEFNVTLPYGLLNFAQNIFSKLNVPYASFDIGHKDGNFFLFEFQFMCLGQFAFEKSKWFFRSNSKLEWEKIYETPDLEKEIANSVINYIKKNNK